jgi:DNA-directed RNA polymerase specialized sigma24 family protein
VNRCELSTLPDEDLIELFYADWGPAGDAAFDAIEARWRPRLESRFRARWGFREEARDLSQVTLLRVWLTRHSPCARYNRDGRFSAWLTRIADNTAKDELRRRGRRPPEAGWPADAPDDWWEAHAAVDQPLVARPADPAAVVDGPGRDRPWT